jgi:uncharacterized protein YciI
MKQWLPIGLFGLFCAVSGGGITTLFTATNPQATAAPVEPPKTYGKANPKKLDAYIVLLRLRHDLYLKWKETGKWPDDKEANQALAGHGEYWQQQLKDGKAILAGGMKGDHWDNVAEIIFEAESEAKANELVKNDPAVKGYVFQAQVRPFDVHWITNKYCEGR